MSETAETNTDTLFFTSGVQAADIFTFKNFDTSAPCDTTSANPNDKVNMTQLLFFPGPRHFSLSLSSKHIQSALDKATEKVLVFFRIIPPKSGPELGLVRINDIDNEEFGSKWSCHIYIISKVVLMLIMVSIASLALGVAFALLISGDLRGKWFKTGKSRI